MSDPVENNTVVEVIEIQKVQPEEKIQEKRIQDIVQNAFSQTFAELKEGSGEIRGIVKKSLSEILEIVKETDEVREGTPEKAPSTNSKSVIVAVFKAIKNQLLTGLHPKYAELKNQAVNLDTNLTERYGDRYIPVKQRLEKAVVWYNTALAQAKTMEPNALQQRQAEFENKLGEAGTTVAQKERHIKQQLKVLLQTATTKF